MAKKKAAKKATKKTRRAPAKPARKKKAPAKKTPARRSKSSGGIEANLKRIDRDVLKLLNERVDLTIKWLQQQGDPKSAVYSPAVDEQLFAALASDNKGPLSAPAVRGIFQQVLSAAKRRVKILRVAYLGPRHSFSHLAAIERFGMEADFLEVSTIGAVFEEVNRGNADYGLVPIENSTDGRVVDTLDMFTRLPLRICGEVQLAIHHNLLGNSPRGEVTEVYSKQQALSQCREWLARNMPHATLHAVASTSTAAQIARDKPGCAAVASRQAAVQYNLQILAEDIEDNPHNVTRFSIIGNESPEATGDDRTAILLQIPHKPGSLSAALELFRKSKINLTWIESFPLRGEETGYLFFLDFEGHQDDAKIKRALKSLESQAVRLEILGSYPASEPV